MKDICFMLHESVADNQQQKGICWQVREDAYVPIKHPQIKEPVPRNKQDGLLESLNCLPVGAPGRIGKEHNSSFRIIPGEMNRGECFFRIVRPIFGEGSIQTGQTFRNFYDQNSLRNIQKQQEILIEILENIFRNIHPHEDNFDVYGHQIRNLIILATTEVESSLTSILQANNITPLSQHFTTRDYVRLKKVLRLEEFEVSLSHYPWLQSFSPFRDWSETQPTKSLKWYNAYNKIKHNRETEFQEAKLLHSVNAIIAVHIMLVSQFGYWGTYDPYFKLSMEPFWPREELYIPPEDQHEWALINLVL
jgi:hypothetical protein